MKQVSSRKGTRQSNPRQRATLTLRLVLLPRRCSLVARQPWTPCVDGSRRVRFLWWRRVSAPSSHQSARALLSSRMASPPPNPSPNPNPKPNPNPNPTPRAGWHHRHLPRPPALLRPHALKRAEEVRALSSLYSTYLAGKCPCFAQDAG